MDHPATHFVTVLAAFFAIMNPIANTAVFVGLTDGVEPAMRRGIALRAVLLAFAIVAVFAVCGKALFAIFGVTLPAFRIAGGALVGLVGYHMLQGEPSTVHNPSEADRESSRDAAFGMAVTPLALPILAGPGTIATAMNFAAESTLPEITRVLVAFAVVCAATLIAFLGGQSLTDFLGRNAIKVVTRLMGLILAVVGVQMWIEGVRGAFALSGGV